MTISQSIYSLSQGFIFYFEREEERIGHAKSKKKISSNEEVKVLSFSVRVSYVTLKRKLLLYMKHTMGVFKNDNK